MAKSDDIRVIANELLDIADSMDGRQGGFLESDKYRLDGFSKETSFYGARRHQAIDLVLDDLINGDEFDRQVAEKADAFLAFDVNEYPGLASGDENERQTVIEARNNAWGVSVVFSRGSYHAPFKIRSQDPDAASNRYFDFIDGHAFVFIKNTNPQHYAEAYAESLAQEAVELRRQAREDETTPPVPYRR
jgi:hypothetical protein